MNSKNIEKKIMSNVYVSFVIFFTIWNTTKNDSKISKIKRFEQVGITQNEEKYTIFSYNQIKKSSINNCLKFLELIRTYSNQNSLTFPH